nr:FixG {C-terminal} [Azorhizobium caulinodans, ORS571, Peptide Partial, 94 aa] [Azorhizobium caulinodans]
MTSAALKPEKSPKAPAVPDEEPLYAARRAIYPQSVHGRLRTTKWVLLILTLGIYYLLPFVRWDRGPNAPDQAVLIDFPTRRFYFFFIEIWPQEF